MAAEHAQGPVCEQAAGEPSFTLFAHDPVAPFLVSIWSSLRYGDVQAAYAKFEAMLEKAGDRYILAPEIDDASRALDRALEMFAWAERRKDGDRPGPTLLSSSLGDPA